MHSANENQSGQILSYPGHLPEKTGIILIGTVHRLEPLKKVLKELLLKLKPGLITVEISPFSVSYRRRQERVWIKKLENLKTQNLSDEILRALKKILEMPYEYLVPKDLGLCPVVPVDLNKPSQKYLREVEKLLENPSLFEVGDPLRELAYLRLFLEGLYRPQREAEDLAREEFMARKIKRLFSLRKPLVHIGGWRHLPGLLALLPEASAICLTPLPDPEKFS